MAGLWLLFVILVAGYLTGLWLEAADRDQALGGSDDRP